MRLGILLDMFDGVSWTFTVPLFFGSKCPPFVDPWGHEPPSSTDVPSSRIEPKGGHWAFQGGCEVIKPVGLRLPLLRRFVERHYNVESDATRTS